MLVEEPKVEGEQTPNPSAPTGQTPNPNGQTPNGNPQQKTELNTLPPDIQDYIKRLRKEAEDANDAIKAEKKAKEQAEQERLKQQGEWQKLAESAQTELGQLKPELDTLKTRYKTVSDLVVSSFKETIKDWPKEVKDLLPGQGDDSDPVEWIAAVNKYKPLAEKLKAAPPVAGNGANTNPAGAVGEAAEIEAIKAKMRAGGRY